MSDSIDQFPEDAQKMIRELRSEAAAQRVAKNDAVSAAIKETEDKLTAQFAAKLADMESRTVELDKANTNLLNDALRIEAALSVGVDPANVKDFADRLRGNSKDEIFADAQNALKLYGAGKPSAPERQPATDPTQGLGTSTDSESPADIFGAFINNQLQTKR